jgi:hypothetical protein
LFYFGFIHVSFTFQDSFTFTQIPVLSFLPILFFCRNPYFSITFCLIQSQVPGRHFHFHKISTGRHEIWLRCPSCRSGDRPSLCQAYKGRTTKMRRRGGADATIKSRWQWRQGLTSGIRISVEMGCGKPSILLSAHKSQLIPNAGRLIC